MLKINQIGPGDVVVTDSGFTCMKPGEKVVHLDDGGLYLECEQGKHYLDGQINKFGYLEGISRG